MKKIQVNSIPTTNPIQATKITQTASILDMLKEISQNPDVKASKVLRTKIDLAIAMYNFNPQGAKETLKEVVKLLGKDPLVISIRSALDGNTKLTDGEIMKGIGNVHGINRGCFVMVASKYKNAPPSLDELDIFSNTNPINKKGY